MEITISIDGRRVSVEVSAEVAECLPYCASPEELIVTTNIPLHDLQHPQDTAHARIYDRLLCITSNGIPARSANATHTELSLPPEVVITSGFL